jgi:L-fucose mutarotase/ribose pyranase (RbsD/FucU family)
MASNEFYVKKDGDKIILTIVSKSQTSIELDIEDAADLALDIQQYINQYINKMEAKEQNDSKNKLSADMNKWIDNHFGKVYNLNPITKEVSVNKLK